MRRAAAAVGAGSRAGSLRYDYVGLNHLGWLRTLEVDGVDRLPGLLASPELEGIEEARLVGLDWVRQLKALNEYLFYYYCNREAVARIIAAPSTRGEFLATQQERFYADAAGRPEEALKLWQATKDQRESTYMAEARDEEEERGADDGEGGYQAVALDLMTALTGGTPTAAIVNVANLGAVAGLPEEAVVEIPCDVDADGIHRRPVMPLAGHMLGLVQSVKAVEQADDQGGAGALAEPRLGGVRDPPAGRIGQPRPAVARRLPPAHPGRCQCSRVTGRSREVAPTREAAQFRHVLHAGERTCHDNTPA